VTKQENVGPYATVQLHSTDASALETWLSQNGFVIPADVMPVIAQYVAEGFDFLAMKLSPHQGVQSMRPVRVTSHGASLSLPLRMAAIGTGVSVGITIWVVSDGRYEPQNFPFFYIDESQLVWDWSTSSSNYTVLRAKNEAALGGKGWEIESSLEINQQIITNAILTGGQYYAPSGLGGFGGSGFSGFPQASPVDATQDYLPIGDPDAGAGLYQSAEDVRAADIAALFAGIPGSNVRVTRIRSDIAHTAMTKDFVLQASADQSEISNIRQVTRSVNLVCPTYPGCPGNGAGSGTAGGSAGYAAGSAGSVGSTAGSAIGSSATAVGNDVAPAGGGGGCAASSQPRGGLAASLGAMAAMMGLIAARLVRARRRGGR
jgi:hypothetical protein